MINHARTLLMNVNGDGYASLTGEEYIPPAYRALVLPGYLANIRDYLFAPAPDRLFLNYRTRQYLSLLHTTELVEFLTDLDSRITYDVDNLDVFPDSVFGLPPMDGLFFVDELGLPDQSGHTYHRWRLTRSTAATCTVERQSPPTSHSVQTYSITSGLSSLIALPGSGASCRFQDSHGIGSEWIIEGYARPERQLGEIVAELRRIGAEPLLTLFGVGSQSGATEPYRVFYSLWKHHPMLPYQLGGLLCAVIYQTEEVRQRHA